MTKQLIMVLILVLLRVHGQSLKTGVSPCPQQFSIGSVITSRITVASDKGLIPLIPNNDIQCYNYSLPYEFSKPPDVALALHDFQTKETDHLFFSIKPLKSESRSLIPLLVRTQWRYTEWVKISFSILAEDRNDFEVGYYELDTGYLGSCTQGKTTHMFMPFRSINSYLQLNHHVFLHGFQVSTQRYTQQQYSPFQIQIMHSNANISGISVILSLTTITQVHSAIVSYVVWNYTDLNIAHGQYILDQIKTAQISHSPQQNIGRNYARIFGITGFIILHQDQQIIFNTQWTGSKFVFEFDQSRPLVKYLSYQYIFFLGSICSDCSGYPYIFDGRCYKFCPQNTQPSVDNVCVDCGQKYYWNGTACSPYCARGQYLNVTSNTCECPIGTFWNDFVCLQCQGGRIYNRDKRICACPSGTRWNGFGCATMEECRNGQMWDPFTFTCKCPDDSFKNNQNKCVKRVACNNGLISDGKNGCKCPNETYWNGNWCENAGCIGGQYYDGKQCVCKEGQHFNGSLCLLCINGQLWDQKSKSCLCPVNYTWNGNWCQKSIVCSGNRVWNTVYNQCLCRNGQFWNGFVCQIQKNCDDGKKWNINTYTCECPSSFNWDGETCVLCVNGKSWNQSQKKCVCREGTDWNGQFCMIRQSCFAGMMWNQNTYSCQCPVITVWNGTYCIANPCFGGKIWNNLKKQCQCSQNRVFINDQCLPPEIACLYGKVWDPKQYKCVCPEGFWQNGHTCLEVPKCQDGRLKNPLNGECYFNCPVGQVYIESLNGCGDPSCPQNQRWNGFGCVTLQCPPNSYFNGTQCLSPFPSDQCRAWQFWDGTKCVFHENRCPQFTEWNGTFCIPNITNCPVGFYGDGNRCVPFPQLCTPPATWAGNKCFAGSNCPHSTYYRNGNCYPYVPCQNGQQWNQDLINCVCPQGTQWNGNRCIGCSGGKGWVPFVGCQCSTGFFEVGSRCQRIDQAKCSMIPNTLWDGRQCLCHDGYDAVGLQCICDGVQINNRCERCAHKPNSEWMFGKCRCKLGYTQYGAQCLVNQVGNQSPSQCNVGTVFDPIQKRCLACPDGCLSCDDVFTCRVCSPDFNFNTASKLCTQFCGDGKRYILECDDGNVNDGDGCSSSCTVELGYTCVGGSPNSQDNCIVYLPTFVTIVRTGQVRYPTKIVVNVKVDYLPRELLQSPDCNDRCSGVLDASIIQGDSDAVSIRSMYVAGSSYAFMVEIQFGKTYIGIFTLQIKVDPVISDKYFGNIRTTDPLIINVNPALLATAASDYLE